MGKSGYKGLLKIVTDYAYDLDILDQYDYQNLKISDTSDKELYRINYKEAVNHINRLREIYGNGLLFGKEKDNSFKSSISTIYQTFDGKDLYPSIEEKAANLLYLVTKNLPGEKLVRLSNLYRDPTFATLRWTERACTQ